MTRDPDARLDAVPGRVVRQPRPGPDDLGRSVELLQAVASRAIPEDRVLRVYTPAPTLAMSRRESRMPGYEAACAAGTRLGFAPAIRPTGGRAVAYDQSCLVFDVVDRDDSSLDPGHYFAQVGNSLADAMRTLGIDARVGDVPGEYCPGEFSINARGVVKLIGTSQRAIRGARLLSGMLAFGPVDRYVAVLREANAALGLEWDPATFGSMRVEAPSITRAVVEDALTRALIA